MPKKFTIDYVRNCLKEKGYTLISEVYKDNKTPLEIQCSNNHIFKMKFSHFMDGRTCKYCKGAYLHFNEVKSYIESYDYKLLSNEYIKNDVKMDILCPEGHKFKMNFAEFQSGTRCPRCQKRGKYTLEDAKLIVESVQGCKLLSNSYINNKTKLEIQCEQGHIYVKDLSHFQDDPKCTICSKRYRYKFEDIKKYVEIDSLSGYKVLSNKNEYKHVLSKIKFRCTEGHEYKSTFSSFKNAGTRCPICNESHGEREIRNFCIINNINYKAQYIFNDLLSDLGNPLLFDFAVFDNDNNLKLLIEFDGIQHTKWIEHMMTKKDFQKLQLHDERKNKYCLKNNIELLRIDYKDLKNINNILLEHFLKLNILNKQSA